MRQTLLAMLLTLGAGFISNTFFTPDFNLFTAYRPVSSQLLEFPEIDVGFLLDLLELEGAVLIDARDPVQYEFFHIPGALSLPVDRFEEGFTLIRDQLPADRPLITYCSDPHCSDSLMLANRLYTEGFHDIFIFKGGIEGWRKYQQNRRSHAP